MRKFTRGLLLLIVAAGIIILAIGCSKLSKEGTLSNPAVLTQGVAAGSSIVQSEAGLSSADLKGTEEQIIKDFKNDLLNMFKAWKARDIAEFRLVAGLGYSGKLLEDKVKEAEPFILEGDGADINNINYLDIRVAKVEGNTAVIQCEYNYTGYEYNSVTGSRGERVSPPNLRRRFTLELKDNQWYIAGEQEVANFTN